MELCGLKRVMTGHSMAPARREMGGGGKGRILMDAFHYLSKGSFAPSLHPDDSLAHHLAMALQQSIARPIHVLLRS